jgi:hypothetical protein
LFEEFVPLEYRQQLAITSSNRRRLPSLFLSGKKQWKQAATLNGRPYVVGHVPQSPSYQEVEFEGLLHGTTSTKLISLTKTPRTQSTVSTGPVAELPLPPVPPLPLTKDKFFGRQGPKSELPPIPPSDDLHSDSTISPSVKKLFKLPSTPGSNRKSMMIPAEYSSVEFETRMASYSDDEHNGNLRENETEAVKQKRRESRDDAWVDILIGSQTRRMKDQDIEIGDRRRGHHSTPSDPDIASLEVAQVLATVRNRSPSPPSMMMERVDRDYGMDHHVEDLEVDEVEPYPRMSTMGPSTSSDESEAVLAYEAENADLESLEPPEPVLTSRQMAKHQRRIGYFDLHPDRRQALAQSILDDDEMRARVAEDSEDDDIDDDRVYGPPDPVVRPLPVPPAQQVQPRILEPSPVVPSPVVDPIATLNLPTEAKEEHPFTPDTTNGNDSSIAPSTPSKTATLIEMYRERERGSPVNPTLTTPVPIIIAPLTPSRLPVRIAPLLKEGTPLPQPPLLSTSSPKPSPKPSPESTRNDLPRTALEETGRSSPARYVHGAPLHNVLEEEEE